MINYAINEIICGENIQNICDVVIGDNRTLRQNPNNFKYSKKMRDINSQIDDTNLFDLDLRSSSLLLIDKFRS